MRPFRISILLLAATLLVSSSAERAVGQVPDVEGWQLIFNDNFDGSSINTNNWVPLNRKDSFNDELQYYHPNQVAVSGGNLRLTAIDTPRDGKAYQSGLVTSKIPYGIQQSGTNYQALRFEARIDLPTTQGMWPAFWLNPNELIAWPKGGEIDILENRGSEPNRVSSAYHWQATNIGCCNHHRYVSDNHNYSGPASGNFHNTFHTYAVEWEPTRLRFYVDDVLHYTVTETTASPPESQNNRPIFEFPKYMILNLAVGGHFGGNPDGTTVFPQTMLVDYVRVWKLQTGVAGDYNGDSVVDAADYAVWRDSMGQNGIGLPADGSGNGSVGQEDYDLWKANFGTGGAGAGAEGVPEPEAGAAITIGLIIASAMRLRSDRFTP